MSLSQPLRIESDQRTKIEAETIRAGFLDQSFIPTMRFSELNGLEEYDNSILWMVWHGYIEWGLQQIVGYNSWIIRELERIYSGLPEDENGGSELQLNENLKKQAPTLDYIESLLDNENVRKTVPYDQRARIYRYFQDLSMFLVHLQKHQGVALDSERVMWMMRTYLTAYNNNLADGVVLYDGHYAILNGRMARNKGHKKDLLKVTENRKEHEKQINPRHHFWNRDRDEEEND